MAIQVDKEKCIACGVCVSICPQNFEMGEDGKSSVISQEVNDCVKQAIESCPVQAISIE